MVMWCTVVVAVVLAVVVVIEVVWLRMIVVYAHVVEMLRMNYSVVSVFCLLMKMKVKMEVFNEDDGDLLLDESKKQIHQMQMEDVDLQPHFTATASFQKTKKWFKRLCW